MSQENVEVVRRGHEAFERGDLSPAFGRRCGRRLRTTTALEAFDPEVICYTAAPLPDPEEYHGTEGFLQWFGRWTEGFEDYVQHAEEYIEAGDHVIAQVYQRGKGDQSGVPVEGRYWFLHTLRDGKVVRMGVHATEDQALEAAGLSE